MSKRIFEDLKPKRKKLSFELSDDGMSVRYGVRPMLDNRINFATKEDASKFMRLIVQIPVGF